MRPSATVTFGSKVTFEPAAPAQPAQANAGIVLVRANERTRAFYSAALELLALGAAPGDGTDQGAFWGVIASGRFPITRTSFDCELVANGRNYFAHPTIGAHAASVSSSAGQLARRLV